MQYTLTYFNKDISLDLDLDTRSKYSRKLTNIKSVFKKRR